MTRAITPAMVLAIILGFNSCGVQQKARSPQEDALLRAAREGHADTVKSILSSPDLNVNAVNEQGNTALIEAARNGHDDVMQALLMRGADVKVKDRQGKTALMHAAEGGHEEAVRLLKQAGAME